MTQPLKTYSHLMHLKRKPTEYEIVCSELLYYTKKGFEVDVPIGQWYEKYQKGSALQCKNWEGFYDPRETTYTKYTAIQREKEIFVDGILQSIEDTKYDQKLSSPWLKTLELMLVPLRYPWHGLQMVSSYVGQMAPSGKIVIAAMFQAADEMRRIQRVTYRMRQLQKTHPSFGQNNKYIWEKDALWQPLRKVVEKLLVTYDWGEAFTALNLVIKPTMDSLFIEQLSEFSKKNGDDLLSEFFYSFNEDCQWQKTWSEALVKTAIADTPANEQIIEGWTKKWQPLILSAIKPFSQVLEKEVY